MRKLDIKSEEILKGIRDFVSVNGCAPTIRELCHILSVKSSQTLHKRLDELRANGLIDWEDGRQRTLRVIEGKKYVG